LRPSRQVCQPGAEQADKFLPNLANIAKNSDSNIDPKLGTNIFLFWHKIAYFDSK
jgi:hypothetical protein